MPEFYEQVKQSSDFILSKISKRPAMAVILGSGLGDFVESMTDKEYIPYKEIPFFPQSTVEGHEGRMVIGTIGSQIVLALQGRFHYYEGYTMKEVAYPVYVMKLMGIERLIITNACGGINTGFAPGTLMLITDFINLMGDNPLRGANDERFGPRFPDMTEPYEKAWIEEAKENAKYLHIPYTEGVYAGFMGPYYETAAEIRAIGIMGADAVGMSTVPETIAANALGIKVLGIACITNMATGIQTVKHSHERVVETAKKAGIDLSRWIVSLVE